MWRHLLLKASFLRWGTLAVLLPPFVVFLCSRRIDLFSSHSLVIICETHKMDDERGSLSSLFDEGFAIFTYLETCDAPTNSEAYQIDIKKAVRIFENVTKAVSSLGLFSNNEDVDELATTDIKFLMLPALLGSLSLRQLSESRADVMRIAEVYFRDFLIRLKDYGMTDVAIPQSLEDSRENGGSKSDIVVGLPDIRQMTRCRDDKIKKYKHMKDLESRIADLKRIVDSANGEEEVKRDYHLTLIRLWVQKALDDLSAIQMEIPLLENMARARDVGDHEEMELKRPKKTPLKPIIITRDAAQKRIYGLGYPSVPTMTVDEFYEQKVKEGTFTIPDMSLQAQANGDFNRISQSEQDAIDREAEAESDNPNALRRDREWDDWKDDHRRGWGNRKNKG